MRYYVNTSPQPTGEHEVHTQNCPHPPNPENRHYLGDFSHCQQAVAEARRHYTQVDGCYYCSNDCHKR